MSLFLFWQLGCNVQFFAIPFLSDSLTKNINKPNWDIELSSNNSEF